MEFDEILRDASNQIVIIGTNPLLPILEGKGQFFSDLLNIKDDLTITILCESDSECFNQALCTDSTLSPKRTTYASMTVHRDRILGKTKHDGLENAVKNALLDLNLSDEEVLCMMPRFIVRQCNLRLPINIIVADSKIFIAITTHVLPSLSDYFSVESLPNLAANIRSFVEFFTNENIVERFLSKQGQELIQMYDREGIPRGIYPRDCFYTTDYERYSIWGFVFNRNGDILLHKRSETTKDGRGLWDKSVGGHVDLRDSSTFITAQRELVEEMFLPEAEFTKYMRADLGDIVHFGEWNPAKRTEAAFISEIAGLAKYDWVLFRATDDSGDPLTITRVSDRRMHFPDPDDPEGKKEKVVYKKTVFRSDVYFFIAPPGFLDSEAKMKENLQLAEKDGAAEAHVLTSAQGLRDWISHEEEAGREREVFTDDILFVNLRYRETLQRFSEFVKYLSRKVK